MVDGGNGAVLEAKGDLDAAREDFDAALAQQAGRAIRILNGLRSEGVAPVLALWALAREASALAGLWALTDQGKPTARAMDEMRVWRSRQALYSRALQQHDAASIRRLVQAASLADRVVKGARRGQPWNALLELVLLLASPRRSLHGGYAA